MKNILMSYFDSVLSLEAFFMEINLKLNREDTERLRKILKNLSSIVIAFDFEFKGPFKSIIDKRYSYEHLLYLCYVKINESSLPLHENHMLRAGKFSSKDIIKDFQINLKLIPNEVEKKLLATENLTISYFLSKTEQNDGLYWRLLHDLVGFSIMKYILLYSFIFRKINHPTSLNNYVQVSGIKFSFAYKTLVSKKLKMDGHKLENLAANSLKTQIGKLVKPAKPQILKEIFQKQDKILLEEANGSNSISNQINKIGNQNLNKNSMLYDRSLGSKIHNRFIYSDRKRAQNLPAAASEIIDKFIFKQVNFVEYKKEDKLEEMKNALGKLVIDLIKNHQSCPFKVFLDCYGKPNETLVKPNDSRKRKRSQEDKCCQPGGLLTKHIEAKNLFAFIRRCLIYVLKSDGQKTKRKDSSFPLVGGENNFKLLCKKISSILSSLKFDSFKLNSLVHGISISRISFLKSIDCDRFKHLLFLNFVRWLFEDYIFVLVKAYFYATDTTKTNSEIFYYTKSDWKNIVKSQLSDPVNKIYRKMYNLEKIKHSDLIGYCNRFETFGAYMGRLYPKNVNNECRIISGCRAYNPCTNRSSNINYKFIALNNCLKWMISRNPELIGFGTRGHIDMHLKYSRFLQLNYLNRGTCDQQIGEKDIFKKWNFIKFDIKKCFDSIQSKELQSYISQLIYKELGSECCFTNLRYALYQIDLDSKQLKQKYDTFTLKHSIKQKGFANGLADYINLLENDSENKFSCFKLRNLRDAGGCIYVPLWVQDRNSNFKKLNDLLKKCLNHVVVKVHDDLYERVNGILQGSICSRNLCDLYLGKIETRLFGFDNCPNNAMKLNRSNEIVMRIVDDYIVIASDVDRMLKIKELLKKELSLNEAKTVIYNFKKSANNANLCLVQSDGTNEANSQNYNFLSNFSGNYFSWCGFNLDVNNLDVFFNYEKYFENSTSLTSRLNSNIDYKFAYVMFNSKFLRLFSANVSVMVIDPETNSLQGILRNFADFFALSAIRFCVLYKFMPSQLINNNIFSLLKMVIEEKKTCVRARLSHSFPFVVKLMEEYKAGFESRRIEYSTPICNCYITVSSFFPETSDI
ncbi:telomerase reverse transcriptase [Brachionus plicatilis]|uniref:Telomerase reverse transcriptase n=1 Tax=Brachionus plicatilis TaxID=10195 RepID=A0A3M7SKH9_BRAPC|nr:telomerase reverse transcriptase [Brachionus plicatilis]